MTGIALTLGRNADTVVCNNCKGGWGRDCLCQGNNHVAEHNIIVIMVEFHKPQNLEFTVGIIQWGISHVGYELT